MIGYSMKDPKWGNLEIDHSGHKMSTHGCLVDSLSMLFQKTPDVVLKALNDHNCFDQQGDLIWTKMLKVIGLTTYQYISGNTPVLSITKPIIAETDHFAYEDYPQHFFLALTDGMIIDSLDGKTKKNPYKIVSLRYVA